MCAARMWSGSGCADPPSRGVGGGAEFLDHVPAGVGKADGECIDRGLGFYQFPETFTWRASLPLVRRRVPYSGSTLMKR